MELAFWIVVAIVAWGTASFFGKLGVENFSSPFLMWARSVVTVAFLLPLVWFQRSEMLIGQPTLRSWLIIILIAVFTAFAVIAFYNGLRIGDASLVVPVTAAYPVLTAILAGLFLGEQITAVRAVGIVVTVIGVALVTR